MAHQREFTTDFNDHFYIVFWTGLDDFEVCRAVDGEPLELDELNGEVYDFISARVEEAVADQYNEDNPECNPDPADQERAWGKH